VWFGQEAGHSDKWETSLEHGMLLIGTKKRNTSILGRVAGTDIYRSLENHPEGETIPAC